MKRTIQSCILYLVFFFFFFLLKKKVATPYHLPKKRGALKSTKKISLFLEANFLVSHSMHRANQHHGNASHKWLHLNRPREGWM